VSDSCKRLSSLSFSKSAIRESTKKRGLLLGPLFVFPNRECDFMADWLYFLI
jgi:hypothetical protein